MTLVRYFWRTAAVIVILLACLAIVLALQFNMTASDGGHAGWAVWLIIAVSLRLAIDELRTK